MGHSNNRAIVVHFDNHVEVQVKGDSFVSLISNCAWDELGKPDCPNRITDHTILASSLNSENKSELHKTNESQEG